MLAGGRGSGKSSFVSLSLLLNLKANPNTDAIVLRKVAATLRESVVPQLIWAADKLSVMMEFHASLMEFVLLSGQKILLRGCDDPMKSKGIKSQLDGFGFVWFEELAEFSSMPEIQTVLQSVVRGNLGSARPVCFYTYNPPRNPHNWVNRLACASLPRSVLMRSTYKDMPKSWLGGEFLRHAKALRSIDRLAYRHMYLGEPVGYSGKIFLNVTSCEIGPQTRAALSKFINGLDFGYAADPSAFVRAAYERGRLYIVGEIYGRRLGTEKLAELILQKCGGEPVICDSASPQLIDDLRRHGVNAVPAKKGPGSVLRGIQWLAERERIIIDRAQCPNTLTEFLEYASRTDHRGNTVSEFPDKNNHSIDALRYACETLMDPEQIRVGQTLRLARIGG
jgi:PBSX family phage terminase large subunit